MVAVNEVATVTSKSMVTIPSRIRKKHGLHQGSRVKFVEVDGSILMVPLKSLKDLHGAHKEYADLLIRGVKDMEREHREKASRDEREARS